MARTSAPAPAPAVPVHHALWRRGRAVVRDLWIGGVLLALIVAFSVDSPYFLTRANWLNTSSTGTEVLLLAVGETFVICAEASTCRSGPFLVSQGRPAPG